MANTLTPALLQPSRRVMDTTIWVTFDKVGFHRYPDAPDEVAYLRQDHRHIFKFKVTITVHHDDREIEFHMFKNRLVSLYDSKSSITGLKVDHKSCEMLAQELHDSILQMYDCTYRMVAVEVSEDGECGSEVCTFGKRLPQPAPRPDQVYDQRSVLTVQIEPGETTQDLQKTLGMVTEGRSLGGDQVLHEPMPQLNPRAAWPFPTGRVADNKADPGQEVMSGEELYEVFRSVSADRGFTKPTHGIRTPEDKGPPYWYALPESEKQVWDETARRLPIERITGMERVY